MTEYSAKDIAQLMKGAKERGKPFVFFTGAGCSISANIPLASDLVKQIHLRYETQIKLLSDEHKQDYGMCMSKLDKDERRDLINPYIEKAQINWAHIALAAMLQSGFVTRVLTFNFDNVLARACGLLGIYPATYDFTSADLSLHKLIVDPAIVHLHGQGYGFTQLNTGDETSKHAQKLSDFVSTTLNTSPSLFIGYSGAADAFFPLLKQKFRGEHRLIWTDYDEQPKQHVKDFMSSNQDITHFIGKTDADQFLVDLAKELGCFPPKLFIDPYGHLLDELEVVTKFSFQEGSSGVDLTAHLREQLKKAQEGINKEPDFEALMLAGDYEAVISDADANTNQEITAWAYVMQGVELSKLAKIKQDESLFKQSFEKYEAALKIKPDMHEAFNNWGNALSDLAKIQQDESLFKQSFEKYEAALKIKPDKHEAFNNWGAALSALALFKTGVEKKSLLVHAKSKLERVRILGSTNLYNLACINMQLGEFEEGRELLLFCERSRTLPDKQHLEGDSDLDGVRNFSWFQDLLLRLS